MKNKILAFICGGIGDQLIHFSQLQAFSLLFSSKVELICQHREVMEAISKGCNWISNVHDIQPLKKIHNVKKFATAVKNIKQNDFEIALICHPSTSFKLAAFSAQIKTRIGFSNDFIDKFLLTENLSQNGTSFNAEGVWGHRPFASLFEDHLQRRGGITNGKTPISPLLSQMENTNKVLSTFPKPHIISTFFSQDLKRCWPVDHAVETLTSISKEVGGTIFISSGNDAKSWNKNFLDKWPRHLKKPVDLRHIFSDLESEIALYHSADLFLGINSFTSNLAMNCDLPSIVLYHKRSWYLNYRDNSIGVFPEDDKNIGNIKTTDIRRNVKKLLAKTNSVRA